MKLAGILLALMGLLLLTPALIVGSQMIIGDVNIDAKALRHRFVAGVLGVGLIIVGAFISVRAHR